MAIDMDDEILQDFLVEAGELLEQLGEQLVELEKSPQDKDLLNAVFRNFHTVKGGAGFLGLDALVEVCHNAEDVFNLLRSGERTVDPVLMDVVLRAYDAVNLMIDSVRAGQVAEHADPAIIATLISFAKGEDVSTASSSASASPAAEPPVENVAAPETADTDFDAMLAEAAGEGPANSVETTAAPAQEDDDLFGLDTPVTSAETADGDEITEDEFEALLDKIHSSADVKPAVSESTDRPSVQSGSDQPSGDFITDDEFEKLLDDMAENKKSPTSLPKVDAVDPVVASVEVAPSPSAIVEPASPVVEDKVVKPEPAKEIEKAAPPAAKVAAPAGKENTAAAADTTVRVDTRRLDDIMNLVGELVLVRNRLATLRSDMNDEVAKTVGNLDLVTADLQNAVMKTRMQPIKKVFGRFPRVVRDLARSLNKQVTLELIGEETDLDKNLVEALADPLVHLVRNAVDHGVESPEDRRKSGKPETGTIKLSAEQEGDHILLMIEDDGAGMDADFLRGMAVDKGLMDEDAAARLDENACYNLIFMPGFSTKSEISDISGRGVGMDVVKTNIEKLNGIIDIDSEIDAYTKIKLKIPLTLAIIQALLVGVQEEYYAIPLASVLETVRISTDEVYTVENRSVMRLRDEVLPLVHLADIFEVDRVFDGGEHTYVVVLGLAESKIGVIVDTLVGQEEIVIKSMGEYLKGMDGVAGATIRGDGGVTLIVDVAALMQMAKSLKAKPAIAQAASATKVKEKPSDYHVMIVDDSKTDRSIMKNALKPLGVTLIEAADGVEALNILKAGDHQFDAMLVDIEMPRMDGYSLAGEIKKYNKYKNLPLIAVTSRTTKADRMRGVEVGMVEYITKPYSPEYLMNVVKRNINLTMEA